MSASEVTLTFLRGGRVAALAPGATSSTSQLAGRTAEGAARVSPSLPSYQELPSLHSLSVLRVGR